MVFCLSIISFTSAVIILYSILRNLIKRYLTNEHYMSIAWKNSPPHLFLLSGFLQPRNPSDLHVMSKREWKRSLGEPAGKAIERMLVDGALETACLEDRLNKGFTVSQIEKILQKNGLFKTGIKSEKIERLINEKPEIAVNYANKIELLICTSQGLQLVDQYFKSLASSRNSKRARNMSQLMFIPLEKVEASLKFVLLGVLSGIIGNRADAAFVDSLEQLVDEFDEEDINDLFGEAPPSQSLDKVQNLPVDDKPHEKGDEGSTENEDQLFPWRSMPEFFREEPDKPVPLRPTTGNRVPQNTFTTNSLAQIFRANSTALGIAGLLNSFKALENDDIIEWAGIGSFSTMDNVYRTLGLQKVDGELNSIEDIGENMLELDHSAFDIESKSNENTSIHEFGFPEIGNSEFDSSGVDDFSGFLDIDM